MRRHAGRAPRASVSLGCSATSLGSNASYPFEVIDISETGFYGICRGGHHPFTTSSLIEATVSFLSTDVVCLVKPVRIDDTRGEIGFKIVQMDEVNSKLLTKVLESFTKRQ